MFDPENPRAYMNAMKDAPSAMGVGGMGGGNPDGAQITFVRVLN